MSHEISKTGIELIAEERRRQIKKEGYTSSHDDSHTKGELAEAAAYYSLTHEQRLWMDNHQVMVAANGGMGTSMWPFSNEEFKGSPENRVRELVKAGALIAAEIDRLQRKKIEERFI